MKGKFLLVLVIVGLLVTSGCLGTDEESTNDNYSIYSISGRVVDSSGRGIEGVKVLIQGDEIDDFSVETDDAEGKWTASDIKGTVSVVCVKEGWTFTPEGKVISQAADDIEFIGEEVSAETYSISGIITDTRDNAISGVTLTSDTGVTANTDQDGYWTMSGLEGTVTITPDKEGWAFDPQQVEVDETTTNYVTFTAVEILAATEIPLTGYESLNGSIAAGNLIADAIRDATGADIALYPSQNVNPTTIAEQATVENPLPIARSNLTFLYRLTNYSTGNKTKSVVVEMSGADLKEFILQRCNLFQQIDLQVSGMTYIYDATAETIDAPEINEDQVYKVAFNSEQYDTYDFTGFELTELFTSTKTEEEMFVEYVKSLGTITTGYQEARIGLNQ